MTSGTGPRLRAVLTICLAAIAIPAATNAMAGAVEVFHADSLSGPMRELKKAFEEKTRMSPSTSHRESRSSWPNAY